MRDKNRKRLEFKIVSCMGQSLKGRQKDTGSGKRTGRGGVGVGYAIPLDPSIDSIPGDISPPTSLRELVLQKQRFGYW
jgi:hypothetical protein